MTQALIDELSRTVGYDRLVTDPGQLMAYGYDATMGYRGDPGVVLLASTETDVSQALKIALVHGIPCDDFLQNGQIVGIDCGAELDGYFGDHARTFAVGNIEREKQRLMDVTFESLMMGIEKAVPGNCVGDIGHAVQSHAEANGYSVVRELVGHGIGTQLHEEPQIPNYGIPKYGYELHSGMCIAIEPMINIGHKEVYTGEDGWTILTKDGKVSAHFEHTIAIKDDGPHILSLGTPGG